jgi:hypothetical protein
MGKQVTRDEFLKALDIVETYMAPILEERERIAGERRVAMSLETFINTMEPSKRLRTALKNYQTRWGVTNPSVEDMPDKKISRTLGMGTIAKAEFLSKREEFLEKQKV